MGVSPPRHRATLVPLAWLRYRCRGGEHDGLFKNQRIPFAWSEVDLGRFDRALAMLGPYEHDVIRAVLEALRHLVRRPYEAAAPRIVACPQGLERLAVHYDSLAATRGERLRAFTACPVRLEPLDITAAVP